MLPIFSIESETKKFETPSTLDCKQSIDKIWVIFVGVELEYNILNNMIFWNFYIA
jgi:hypothetical protein